MRVWIDVSNSPQVPFFRPLIALLRERGHEVEVTTREFAQTIELLRLHGIPHEVVGPAHGGGSVWGKARATAGRLPALRRFAKSRGFDVALSHASHEPQLVARSLGIPSAYAFDYEFARVQHGLGCRAARRVVVPDAIPQERLDRLGARTAKVRRFPGLEEEYYLAGFESDRSVLTELGIEPERILVGRPHAARRLALPPPREPALRGCTPAARLGRGGAGRRPPAHRRAAHGDRGARAAVARPPGARDRRAEPRRAVGPRRLGGGHDEPRGGRTRRARLHDLRGADRRRRRGARSATGGSARSRSADELVLEKRGETAPRVERDPALLLDLLLSAL